MPQSKWPPNRFTKAQKPTAAYAATGLHHYSKEEVHYLLDSVQMDFQSMPWDVIKSIVNQGLAESFFALGDTKTEVGKDGVERSFRIIDFGHYAENDIVIEQAGLIPSLFVWWNSSASSDEDNYQNNYMSSSIRYDVNTLLSNNFSTELQVVVSKTSYQVAKNGKSGTPLVTLTDKLFLGAEKEYFGARTYSMTVEANALTQFAFYATESPRKNGSYWERSPSVAGSTQACFVNGSDGTANAGSVSVTRLVSPIFTIKPSV